LYDPATGIWTATGSLTTPRWSHTATLLPNGTVLVSGGQNGNGFLARAEVYDPAMGAWTSVGLLVTPRYEHTATLLPNGKVLLSGGFGGAAGAAGIGNPVIVGSAELYDPVSKSWTATGSLTTARYTHTATLLPNGKVLVSGGAIGNNIAGGATGTMAAIASAELYDPATGIWTATGSLLQARYSQTATLLPSGLVLVCGGWGIRPSGGLGPFASAELYDPVSGNWAATGAMVTTGNSHAATLLSSGKVLVSGGSAPGFQTWDGIAEEYF
jgi:N-acetylneuraminic acid mutarotase